MYIRIYIYLYIQLNCRFLKSTCYVDILLLESKLFFKKKYFLLRKSHFFCPKTKSLHVKCWLSLKSAVDTCIFSEIDPTVFNPEHNQDGQKLTRRKIVVENGTDANSPPPPPPPFPPLTPHAPTNTLYTDLLRTLVYYESKKEKARRDMNRYVKKNH